jgi:hypothetical protein
VGSRDADTEERWIASCGEKYIPVEPESAKPTPQLDVAEAATALAPCRRGSATDAAVVDVVLEIDGGDGKVLLELIVVLVRATEHEERLLE